MTKLRKLALLATAGMVAVALVACGDDEPNNGMNQPESGVPEGSTSDQFVPPGEGGGGDGGPDGAVDLSSFPKYVKSLIENKTDDKGKPDLEAVWGAIPDDEKFVYPATFFP